MAPRLSSPTEVDVRNVLFLCTGNSARSILAEAVLNSHGAGHKRFRAYSAGSHPRGAVSAMALDVLREHHISTEGLRSKSWDEFARDGAPRIDFVVTVCDQAASEPCPVWPGRPVTAHWGMPDPAAVQGSEEDRRRAFRDAFVALRRRIELLVGLPFETLNGLALRQQLEAIDKS